MTLACDEVRTQQGDPVHRLIGTIPGARFARYVTACQGTGVEPIEVYLWASRVALAMFDDLGHVEVALRTAIAERLYDTYGSRWFERTDILDYPTFKLIQDAKRSGGLGDLQVDESVYHGKLVATLMFGFWVKILGKGTNFDGQRRIYDTLIWKAAVREAFPNVGDLEREKVERAARDVKELRNRVAHHEHIVWGVPLPGKRDTSGRMRRMSVTEAHNVLLRLAGYVDRGLHDWVVDNSRVPLAIQDCPLPSLDRFRL